MTHFSGNVNSITKIATPGVGTSTKIASPGGDLGTTAGAGATGKVDPGWSEAEEPEIVISVLNLFDSDEEGGSEGADEHSDASTTLISKFTNPIGGLKEMSNNLNLFFIGFQKRWELTTLTR